MVLKGFVENYSSDIRDYDKNVIIYHPVFFILFKVIPPAPIFQCYVHLQSMLEMVFNISIFSVKRFSFLLVV